MVSAPRIYKLKNSRIVSKFQNFKISLKTAEDLKFDQDTFVLVILFDYQHRLVGTERGARYSLILTV